MYLVEPLFYEVSFGGLGIGLGWGEGGRGRIPLII